jgi:peroxiredoxin
LIELYDVKVPVFTLASRTTFVIGKDRKIVSVTSGGDAVDPTAAISAAQQVCSAN